MEMTQTWIVFTIEDQQVFQIEYKGCTGQDVIDAYKTMLAGEYKVQEAEVKIVFKDDLKAQSQMNLKTRVTSSELVKDVREALSWEMTQN